MIRSCYIIVTDSFEILYRMNDIHCMSLVYKALVCLGLNCRTGYKVDTVRPEPSVY